MQIEVSDLVYDVLERERQCIAASVGWGENDITIDSYILALICLAKIQNGDFKGMTIGEAFVSLINGHAFT